MVSTKERQQEKGGEGGGGERTFVFPVWKNADLVIKQICEYLINLTGILVTLSLSYKFVKSFPHWICEIKLSIRLNRVVTAR